MKSAQATCSSKEIYHKKEKYQAYQTSNEQFLFVSYFRDVFCVDKAVPPPLSAWQYRM